MWVMLGCCYCLSYVWKIIWVCFEDRLYEDTEILLECVKYKDIFNVHIASDRKAGDMLPCGQIYKFYILAKPIIF